MRRIRTVVPDAIGRSEVIRTARAQRALRQWQEVVGDHLAKRSHPDRYTQGTVWVAVEGSAWAQELRLMKPKILERLGNIAGDPSLFRDVRFGVRKLPQEALADDLESPEGLPKGTELSIREIAQRRLAKMRKDAASPPSEEELSD
jgi:predicted nucleic acid-binding Zn ribbon protein